jgi:proteic killer suppression protein
MIRSFGNKSTEDFYHGRRTAHSRKIVSTIRATALRKLDIINAAFNLDDLRSPPGNHLEKLSGNLIGYHSIRINQQWRIIFKWQNGGAEDVKIIDYH